MDVPLRNLPASPESGVIVLTVSPFPEDYRSLRDIFAQSKSRIYRSDCRAEAIRILQQGAISVVICECELPDGNWKDLLADTRCMQDEPLLIVGTRLADDRLWAEVLNLGGY